MGFDPLRIAYFLCADCDTWDAVLVQYCIYCDNICCSHLYLGNICFQCSSLPEKAWPDWHLRFPLYANPLAGKTKGDA